MTRLLRIFIGIAILLVALGTLAGLVSVGLHLSRGEASATTLPIRIDPARASEVTQIGSGKPVGSLVLDRGTLNVRAGGAVYALVQGLDIVVVGGLWLVILIAVRALIGQTSRGRRSRPGR